MPEEPKILTREEVRDSRLFRVDRVDLEFSNGVKRTYEYLKAGEVAAVIIVPITDQGEFLLVEEYGIGVGRYEWSCPKGKVDPGESHIDAANRELKEEAGFGAREFHLLKCLSQSPNYMQHRTQIVLCRDLYEEKLPGDEPEDMAVKKVPIAEVGEFIANETITEARSIAALYLAREWVAQND